MPSMSDAFWHKGQQQLVGSRCYGKALLAIKTGGSGDGVTTAAVDYSIASTGQMYTLPTMATVDLSGGTSAGDIYSTSHANNPLLTVTDDSSTSIRILRQNAAGVTIPTLSQAYIVFTADASVNIYGYMGEIVLNTQTAKRPRLDLSAECAWGELLLVNGTGSDFVIGTTALDTGSVTDTFANLSFMPAD